MESLSVAIVCKNSAPTIGRTLESVAGLAGEVVAVDSGSTDGTIELLERHGARVIRSEWKGFRATKQVALDTCTRAWVLCLDSDESVLPDLRGAIERALASGPAKADGYLINRRVYYKGRPLRFAWQPEHRLLLVRRGAARWEGPDPHPELRLASGSTPPLLSGDLRHDAIGTFADFLGKQVGYSRTMATSLHAAGMRGSRWKLVTSPPGAFFRQLLLKQAWRDGWPGWLAAASTATATLMKHAMLLELSKGDGER